MKVFVHGRDGIGWSIDSDRRYLIRFLSELDYQVTKNAFTADVLHSVWWNQLLAMRNYPLRFKRKIIATATNNITPDNKDYQIAKRWVTLWIAPSKRQFEVFARDGVNAAYQPFYADENIFRNLNKSREELADSLDIDINIVKDKILIGSFQRDTLGADLKSPKWQKGPELLIDILSSLQNREKWLLLLAGPRRHFIINECEKRGIPYYYYGHKPTPNNDDIGINTISLEKMVYLYNLIDCYLITSVSEGGPKAILEASLCKRLIFSTDVGLAPDILDEQCIYDSLSSITPYLVKLINHGGQEYFEKLVLNNSNNVIKLCSYKAIRDRWQRIYESI